MAVRYTISSELNILLYIFEGLAKGSDFFDQASLADDDEDRNWGMRNIFYFTDEVNFDFE